MIPLLAATCRVEVKLIPTLLVTCLVACTMTHQDAACAALVVMSSVTEESSSTSLLLSTERPNGPAPGSVDRVSNTTVDVGPTEVNDNSILAGLGMIKVYDPLSRGANPVGDRGRFGASAGEPNFLNFEPNGGSSQTEFKLVGGFSGQELAASLADRDLFSSPKLQRRSVTRELDMGSQPSEYPAWSGVTGGASNFGQSMGEYPGNPGVSFGVHANPNANPFMNISPIADVSPYRHVNPFVQQQQQSPMFQDHVVNEYARLGVMGFCRDDERVTITKRELNELVQSRKHAEDMLQIINNLELTLSSQEQTVVLLRKEWDTEVKDLKREQFLELQKMKRDYDRWQSEFVHGFHEERNDQAKLREAEMLHVRSKYNVQLAKTSEQYQQSLDIITERVKALELENKSLRETRKESNPVVFRMDAQDDDVRTERAVDSFETCTGSNLNQKNC